MNQEISLKQAKSRVSVLRLELDRHNHLYYIENNPQISDSEFDQLLRELISLEKNILNYIPLTLLQTGSAVLLQMGLPHSTILSP